MLAIRLMNAADIQLGMCLKDEAGWNQTAADWRRALELEPLGCFVAELDSNPVGTVTTCIFGPVAWVAMVLVRASMRGQGIGRALMTYALQHLDNQGVESVRLDATPLGKPLYEKLGFRAEYELIRHAGTLPSRGRVPGVENAQPADWEQLLELDRMITATDRRKLLVRLFTEGEGAVRMVQEAGNAAGYLIARRGTQALLIGPCLASTDAGPRLFKDACHRYAGPAVYVDIPIPNRHALELAQSWGLLAQRRLVRMGRGRPLHERLEEIWASSGPEKG
jgi:GNAT superfamily N-acetyltransferase